MYLGKFVNLQISTFERIQLQCKVIEIGEGLQKDTRDKISTNRTTVHSLCLSQMTCAVEGLYFIEI